MLLQTVGGMDCAFRLIVYSFLFYEPIKFRGYQNCTTTIMTQHLLSIKLCLGGKIQLALGKKCPALDGTNT